MMKQKLSLVKYETAFVPPKINFRQKQTNKKNKHLSNALLPLVLGQIRTISSTSVGTPSGLLPKILCDRGASFFFVSSLSCFVSNG